MEPVRCMRFNKSIGCAKTSFITNVGLLLSSNFATRLHGISFIPFGFSPFYLMNTSADLGQSFARRAIFWMLRKVFSVSFSGQASLLGLNPLGEQTCTYPSGLSSLDGINFKACNRRSSLERWMLRASAVAVWSPRCFSKVRSINLFSTASKISSSFKGFVGGELGVLCKDVASDFRCIGRSSTDMFGVCECCTTSEIV